MLSVNVYISGGLELLRGFGRTKFGFYDRESGQTTSPIRTYGTT